MTTIPLSAKEHWDRVAEKVKKGKGEWVLVYESPESRRGGRNTKIKENLERRGLTVEVTSRTGSENGVRAFTGTRTWARVIA